METALKPDLTGIGSRRITDESFLAFCTPRIAWLYRYWRERSADREMPRRADIDPVDFPKLLSGMLLIDVEGAEPNGAGNYRYRVVGTQEVRNRGFDPTGKPVAEGYYAESLEDALESYEFVRREKSFLYDPVVFMNDRMVLVDEYSILLPLSDNGEAVSQILVYSERRPRRHTRPSARAPS